MKPSQDDHKTIAGLVAALKDKEFIYRTRCEDTLNGDGKIITRKLIQI
jgi:hypothetical protein